MSRNVSVGHARTRSAQYDWVSLIALATDLPHEIESKRQPVHQPANSIEDDARGKKTRAKPRKTTKIESVLLCRTTTSHNYFITSTSQQLCDTVRVNMNSVLFFSYFFFQKGKSSTSFVYSVLNLYKYARTERIRDSAKQLMRKVSLEIRS